MVKDDIEHGYLKVIPLWQFGLMYWKTKFSENYFLAELVKNFI
jgi:hypothetical protein